MSQVAGTTDTTDLAGMAEDVEDIIFNISPMDTYALSTFKRKKASAVNHQWQTDALDSPASNAQVEGDDATYATAATTTMLSNRTQISRKTLLVSKTADAVRKYGRAEEFAYQLAKRGKEIKRDIETDILSNNKSSVGGSATARLAAGLESMISGNRVIAATNTTGTTPGYSGGDWASPTDGTATATVTETMVKTALQNAWSDGGDPSVILLSPFQKQKFSEFSGANKYAGFYNPQAKAANGAIVGGVDVYVSDFGSHKLQLSRYLRSSGRTIFCLDPEYVSIAWLRPIKYEDLAKTGDASKGMLIGEWTLVCDNPDAHAKISDLPTS